ncbi:MAG: hypothetical protein WAO98_04290 [Alphaproteobacteria bacterium]
MTDFSNVVENGLNGITAITQKLGNALDARSTLAAGAGALLLSITATPGVSGDLAAAAGRSTGVLGAASEPVVAAAGPAPVIEISGPVRGGNPGSRNGFGISGLTPSP